MRDQELIGLYEAYQQVHKLQEEETGAGPRVQDTYDVRDARGGPKGGGTIRGPKKRKNILKVSKELMSSYDNWVGQLISDGYDLSTWTDEGLFEYYEQLCEESLEKGQSPTPGGINPKRTPAIPPKPPKGTKVNTGYEESYDIVFEYLISEGYADTNENALVIMANMSEEWRESIVEGYQEPRFGKKDYLKKLSKRGGMGMGTPEDPHGYRDPKMAKVGAEFSKRKTAAMKAKKSGEPDTYRAEKEAQSKYR